MLVGEVLKRKNDVLAKIEELDFYLDKLSNKADAKENNAAYYTDVLGRIFALLDELQNYLILLERSNLKVKVKVGTATISVSDAVKVRHIIDQKITAITNLINSDDTYLNVPKLIEDREKFKEEFILLNNVIEKSDWSTEID
jgi:hypothetical protein